MSIEITRKIEKENDLLTSYELKVPETFTDDFGIEQIINKKEFVTRASLIKLNETIQREIDEKQAIIDRNNEKIAVIDSFKG